MTELLSLLVPASAPASATASQPGTAAPVDAAAFTQALKQAMAGSAPATTQAPANADETTSLPLPAPVTEPAMNVEAAPVAPPAPQAVVTASVAGSDPGAPTSRSLDTLDPEFRTRLERVIGRVERELGYEVRVLETYRTPERQNALYEQGRTTAGPVVTWTRKSLHLEGRASDLQLVGAAKDPNAYARLGTIAAEEGLRTLGPRDPGHVELPLRAGESTQARLPFAAPGAPAEVLAADAADANQRIMAIAQSAGRTVPRAQDVATYVHEVARTALAAGRTTAPAPAPAPAQPAARVSRGAPVAAAAQTAAARVGTSVTPGHSIDPQLVPQPVTTAAPPANASAQPTAARAPLTEAPAPITDAAPQPAAATRRAAGERVYGAERNAPATASVEPAPLAKPVATPANGAEPAPERSTETTASSRPADAAPPSPPAQPVPVQSQEPATAPAVSPRAAVQETATADVASRIERVVALQESLAAQPVHSVLLRLDQDDASLAQIRVGVRGSEVMAALNVADPQLADALRAEMPELQRALEKHGLDTGRSDGLRVLGGALAEGISTARTQDTGTRGHSDTPYRQPQGGHRDPQQRSRGQQREQKEQP